MKRFVLLLCGLVLPGVLLAGTYKLDVSHTKVGFEVTHLVISTVEGRFTEFDGTFDFDEKKGVLSGVKVTIVSKSIDTANEKRDKHLRSDDFFNTEKYPRIEFVSTKEVKGIRKLTIRNKTHDVTLKVTYRGSVVNFGKSTVGFDIEGEINRKKFDVLWNKKLDTGGVMVSDEVVLSIHGEARAN